MPRGVYPVGGVVGRLVVSFDVFLVLLRRWMMACGRMVTAPMDGTRGANGHRLDVGSSPTNHGWSQIHQRQGSLSLAPVVIPSTRRPGNVKQQLTSALTEAKQSVLRALGIDKRPSTASGQLPFCSGQHETQQNPPSASTSRRQGNPDRPGDTNVDPPARPLPIFFSPR